MFKRLSNKLTNNYKSVPLFYVDFDLNKYLKNGDEGSCDLGLHPSLRDDAYIELQLRELVDYIRDNYDMKELSK